MADEDVYSLVLDVNAAPVEAATAKVEQAEAGIYKFAKSVQTSTDQVGESFKDAARDVYKFGDSEQFLDTVLSEIETSAKSTTGAINSLASAQRGAASATTEASKGMKNVGRAALEASRGIEDLQYGFGGVVNNIPSLVMAFGGGAGLTAVISLAAIGVNQLINHWDDLASLWETRNPVPEAADKLENLKDAIDSNNKQLDTLKKKTSLSNAELATFNGLVAENIKLEKEQDEERAKRQRIKQALDQQGQEEGDRGKDFREALDGRGKEVLNAIEQEFRRQAESSIKRERRATDERVNKHALSGASTDEQAEFAEEQERNFAAFVKQARGDWKSVADDLFDRALRGEETAARQVQRMTEGTNSHEFAQFGQRFAKQVDERRKRLADAADKKLTDELNRQGKETEQEALAALARQHGLERTPKTVEEFNRAMEAKEKKAEKDSENAAKDEKHRQAQQEKLELEAQRRKIGRENNAENAAIQSSGVDKMAEAMLGQIGAQGGIQDNQGRVRRMNEDQQFDFVQRQVDRWLHRQTGEDQFGRAVHANAGMGPEQTMDLAMRITALARLQLEQDMIGQSGQGLTQQQAAANAVNRPAARKPAPKKAANHGFRSVAPEAPEMTAANPAASVPARREPEDPALNVARQNLGGQQQLAQLATQHDAELARLTRQQAVQARQIQSLRSSSAQRQRTNLNSGPIQ